MTRRGPRTVRTMLALTLGAVCSSALLPSPALAATGASGGVVSFTFDDGKTGQYTNARPVLKDAGYKGTFFIISDALSWGSSYMTPSQVKTLAGEGHEIGNHTKTHAKLTKLSSSEVKAEFSKSQSAIAAKTGVTPRSCAYPYGSSNSTVESIAADYFTSCRKTTGGTNSSSTDPYRLSTYYVHTSTTASQIRKAVDKAKASNTWLILCYHGVGKVSTSDDVSTSTFLAHVNAVKASGVKVRTVGDVIG